MRQLERVVAGLVEKIDRRVFGKYEGTVVDNQDPDRLGRLRLSVPAALGPTVVTGWARPCVPYGGAADQGLLFIPERGAHVWVEFAAGDIEFPIWVGTVWMKADGKSQLPRPLEDDGSEADDVQDPPTRKILRTFAGHTVQFEDADGAEAIVIREGRQGHMVTLDADGITVVDKAENTIVLSEDGIQITDKTGNSIEMTSDAMTLTAKTDFTINAAGKAVTIIGATVDFTKG